MKKDNKKALYESIMASVAKEVKKALNEDIDPEDTLIFSNKLMSYVEMKKGIEDGWLKLDGTYKIPSLLTNKSNKKLDALLGSGLWGIVKIYGIQDKLGNIYINKDDYDRIADYANEEGLYPWLERHRKVSWEFQLVYIDFRTDETIKHSFFDDSY